MKYILITLLISLVIYLIYITYRKVNLAENLNRIIENGAIILDVRTPAEYKTGHITGSINISLGEIRERYTELDLSKTYITVCSHGLRSIKVQQLLKERGFKQVYNGGVWKDIETIVNKH